MGPVIHIAAYLSEHSVEMFHTFNHLPATVLFGTYHSYNSYKEAVGPYREQILRCGLGGSKVPSARKKQA